MNFIDRVSSKPNKKKITIISQTPNEIIATIERADEPTVEGTAITAQVFTNFQTEINTANSTATNALTNANQAKSDATTAKNSASSAETNANTAIATANQALTKANEALNASSNFQSCSTVFVLQHDNSNRHKPEVNTYLIVPIIFG